MIRFAARLIDRVVIRLAARHIFSKPSEPIDPHPARELKFKWPEIVEEAPSDLTFITQTDFRFTSRVRTKWPNNNTVSGRFYRADSDWRRHPTVLLLHGWNAEPCWRHLFPRIAQQLAARQINTVSFDLPYHGNRRPRTPARSIDFISEDLVQMKEAVDQALADAGTITAWLRANGGSEIGLWGFSLGGWLAGLTICLSSRYRLAVLFTPVADMARGTRELAFCEPVRRALRHAALDLSPLTLATHQPRLSRDNILLVEGRHDLFAPAATIEDLWRQWNQPAIFRVPQGHISALLNRRLRSDVLDWIARQFSSMQTG